MEKNKYKEAQKCVSRLLGLLGHDVENGALRDTPRRVVDFVREFKYRKNPDFEFTVFLKETDGMITEDGIPYRSICEHHLLPFTGTAKVGYLPREYQVGLSKIPRTVEFFATRLQNQERLTAQIAKYLSEKLRTPDVGVILKGEHSCTSARGVKAHGVITTTSELLGAFKTDPTTRAEFLG